MAVKDRINKINPYFKEMQIITIDNKQVIYVVVEFPNGWVIADDLEEKYNITISEGKYHQIKRMFGTVDLGVVELERISIGGLTLPENLAQGECEELSKAQLSQIFSN